jgi:hypothetical protein
LLRQFLKTLADVMELVNFVQDCFKSHGYAPFMGPRKRKLQMDCLAQRT